MFNFSFKELKSEFKKIVWPDKKELAQKTAIVVVFCAVFAVITAFTIGCLSASVNSFRDYLFDEDE